jgi:hypothetical protein
MIAALLLTTSLVAGPQTPTATPQLDPKLIRVHVQTDDGGDASELAARRESVKHLLAAVAGKKKAGLVVADAEEAADVVVEVESRGVTVPKVVIGLSGGMGSPSGRPGAPTGPVRVARLDVTIAIARHGDPSEITNKNRPNETASGWKSAADDVAKQIEKWIADRREAIIEARRRR